MDLNKFLYPPKEYRTAPFWAWNDRLQANELRWQIRQMKKQGFGGFFMHAREGLRTPYLSTEWFELIKAAVNEAQELDLEAWLYDEDRWPSGCAGGLVTSGNQEYKAKYLIMESIMPSEIGKYTQMTDVVVYQLVFEKSKLVSTKRIRSMNHAVDSLNNGEEIVYTAFQVKIQKPTVNSNEHGYIDVLNPEAVQKFINVTHEKYKDMVGRQFGTTIPGVFADEPTYRSKAKNSIPWSKYFPEYFSQQHGYDIIDYLPALFYDCDDSAKVRYDYYVTLTKKFVECFTKPLFDWCEKNKLKFTGHYLSEDTMVKQTNAIGSVMSHYQYMHIPGIDHLGNNIGNPLTLKQCASVGHQFDRKRLICEIFGVSGHAMTFEDQKWIADFHLALGITFFSQHLMLYSMVGKRKRDYPPTFSYHQPYWEDYKQINDYMARASFFVSQGEYHCETVVLHPIGSVWATFSRKDGRPIPSFYDEALIRLQSQLLAAQIPFDYGDELIMEDNAKVVKRGEKTYLQIGKCLYSTVIIPPSLTWPNFIYELINDFINQGGIIIMQKPVPTMINGKDQAEKWANILQNQAVVVLPDDHQAIMETLVSYCHRYIEIITETGEFCSDILVQVRKDHDNYYCFVANTSREKPHSISISVPDCSHIQELNLNTGKITEVQYRVEKDGALVIDTTIAPIGSRAYLMTAHPINQVVKTNVVCRQKEIPLTGQWYFKRTHDNSITLDYCSYEVPNQVCGKTMPVWRVRDQLWAHAGHNNLKHVQPWVLEAQDNWKSMKIPVTMRFLFYAEYIPPDLGLVIETAEHWQLQVNEHSLSTTTDNFCWDKRFGRIDITKAAIHGKNTIKLTGAYHYGIEIEDIYLVGDFAVKQRGYNSYTVIREPCTLTNGSWVYQGYPFYAGNMVYKTKFELTSLAHGRSFWIRLNNPKGTLFKVAVNNRESHKLISQPWEVDITGDCIPGENLLSIEVIGSLRNTFGPLHHSTKSPRWCGPNQFVDTLNWVDSYQFEDYGLIDGASLVIKGND